MAADNEGLDNIAMTSALITNMTTYYTRNKITPYKARTSAAFLSRNNISMISCSILLMTPTVTAMYTKLIV